MNPSADDEGNTARAISDSTDGVPVAVGRAWTCTASQDTPTNIAIAIAPRTRRVVAAFRPCGRRNALTPFAIASTPVSAVDPDANARRTTNVVIAPAPTGSGWGTTACGHPLVAHLVRPMPIKEKMDATNAYVGMAGTRPTAPGRLATQFAHHTIASMPHPITQSGAASSPSGIATSVASAAGMTMMLQIGMATRLARMANSCVLWKW